MRLDAQLDLVAPAGIVKNEMAASFSPACEAELFDRDSSMDPTVQRR